MGQRCCKGEPQTDVGDVTVPTVPIWKTLMSVVLVFAIFVSVQVSAQAYSVLIPVGLRCFQNDTYECQTDVNKSVLVNATVMTSGNNCYTTAGCIEFGDAEQGVLTGLTSTTAYLIAGIPLAKLTTAGYRVLTLVISQVVVFGMAVVTAGSENFFLLWLTRQAMALCEVASYTVALSLVSNYFLAMDHAKATSSFYFVTTMGIAGAYFLGGLNGFLCWRWVFYCMAAVGVVMFLLVLLFLREPAYEATDSLVSSRDYYTIKETAVHLKNNRAYLALCAASCMRQLSAYALWAWLPTFYARAHRLPSESFGPKVGLVVLAGGGLGCLAGALLAHRISKYGRQRKVYMIAASQLVAAPAAVATLLVSSAACSFCLLFLACVAAEIAPGPAAGVVKDLFPVNLSPRASAVYVTVSNVIGGTGPLLIAGIMSLSRMWSSCDQGVGYALAILLPALGLLSALLFVLAGCLMPRGTVLSEETIYLKYESSEADPGSDTERETIFYGSHRST